MLFRSLIVYDADMSIPANSGNWKGITQNRLSATGSSSYAVMNSGPDPARIGSRIGVPKKKVKGRFWICTALLPVILVLDVATISQFKSFSVC